MKRSKKYRDGSVDKNCFKILNRPAKSAFYGQRSICICSINVLICDNMIRTYQRSYQTYYHLRAIRKFESYKNDIERNLSPLKLYKMLKKVNNNA